VAFRKNIDRIAPEALAAFRKYEWPGNVRELRNVIERAMILEDGDEIIAKYLPRGVAGESRAGSETRAGTRPDQIPLPPDGISLEELKCL
jgi:two-component system response regulator AtoC